VEFCGFLWFWFALLGGYAAGLCTWFMLCWIIVLRNFLFIFEFGLLLDWFVCSSLFCLFLLVSVLWCLFMISLFLLF